MVERSGSCSSSCAIDGEKKWTGITAGSVAAGTARPIPRVNAGTCGPLRVSSYVEVLEALHEIAGRAAIRPSEIRHGHEALGSRS